MRKILREWNETDRDFQAPKCLHLLFEDQVERSPDNVAVESDGAGSLTYRELDERANQLAHRLKSLGVGPEDLVGIHMERSIEIVVAFLGILKAGGAYVPLDRDYPMERLEFMLADSEARVLITQKHLLEKLPASSVHTIVLDEPGSTVLNESRKNPNIPVSPENLAYMIYTSGSTGRPKGTLNNHEGICNRLLWAREKFPFSSDDVVLQKTPISFDVSVWEFFWPLIAGARLLLSKPGGHKDSLYIAQCIIRHNVTIVHFVPPMLRLFLEEPLAKDCTSVRRVFCSGEALSHDLQEKFFSRLGGELHNLYGPTETAVEVTHWSCQRNADLPIVPIGRPIANTRCYILDEQLNPLPEGALGELHIGGIQVGRGYLKRPELTAKHFIADPFSPKKGARLYKTGDLARYLPDGNIEFLGRIDFQVKIRGVRIELGEVEAALAKCEGVAACVVVALPDPSGSQALTAYVVPKGEPLSSSRLRDELSSILTPNMIPSFFVQIKALPLTANGKVDRKALPTLPPIRENEGSGEGSHDDQEAKAPVNDVEARLIKIWEKILQRPGIGRKDDFFAIGGTSLSGARLLIEIDKNWGCRLSIPALFQDPTVEGIAGILMGTDHAPEWKSLVPLQTLGNKTPLFMVHARSGDVYDYIPLAKSFAPDQPVYGLQAVSADGTYLECRRVEDLAAHYINEMLQVQPQGPYQISGWSVGGWVAYEMAYQLRAKGHEVRRLILLDTYPNTPVPWWWFIMLFGHELLQRFLRRCRDAMRLSGHERWQSLKRGYVALMSFVSIYGKKEVHSSPDTIQAPRWWDIFPKFAGLYRPQPTDLRIDFFMSKGSHFPLLIYWKRYAFKKMTVHKLNVWHNNIFGHENLGKMKKKFEAILE